VTFKYDPLGRRIYKSSSSSTSVFAYDGDNLIEETNTSGAVVARYSQGQNIDEPLAMLRSSATSYYHADGLGSITSLSSGAGALTQTYAYDSFGKQTSSSGSLTNPFQYAARESDIETGLYYYRARYYDPSVGRFTSEDPISSRGGINFYVYVGNSSPQLTDPYGLIPSCHLDPNSRCAQLFKQIFHSTPKQFNDDAAKIPWFYFPDTNSMNNLTWDFISGNGDPTLLRTTFAPGGPEAATASGGSPTNPSPVVLGPDWFLDSPAHGAGVRLHEAVHSVTGWSDSRIFNVFAQYGLPTNDYRRWGNTDEWTIWLMEGCPQ
jgi:RHS repeat-associated protein